MEAVGQQKAGQRRLPSGGGMGGLAGCFGHLVPKFGSRLKGHLEEVLCSLFPEETWAFREAGLGLLPGVTGDSGALRQLVALSAPGSGAGLL